MNERIDNVLEAYSPIGLDGMGAVRLMNRVDTKYVTTESSLLEFLSLASSRFYVVEIGLCRNIPYSTCYYDTPDCSMYYEHVRGRASRQKIRMREYVNTGAKFLEIKRKNNRGRTDKKRVRVDGGKGWDRLDDFSGFILKNSVYRAEDLVPTLRNRFRRITLVDRAMTERLTIDTGLQFASLLSGRTCSLDSLAVIELKRDGSLHSDTAAMLHSLHIHPSGFSKYCMGMALTDPSLRQNGLKPKIRMVSKLLHSCSHDRNDLSGNTVNECVTYIKPVIA